MSLIHEVLVGGQEADGDPSDLRSAADALWALYWQDRSREHRNQLVLFYAPLVTIVAKRFAPSLALGGRGGGALFLRDLRIDRRH